MNKEFQGRLTRSFAEAGVEECKLPLLGAQVLPLSKRNDTLTAVVGSIMIKSLHSNVSLIPGPQVATYSW